MRRAGGRCCQNLDFYLSFSEKFLRKSYNMLPGGNSQILCPEVRVPVPRGGRPRYSGRFLDVKMGGTAYGRASANVGTSKYAIGIGVFQSSFLKLLGRSHLSISPKERCEMARPATVFHFWIIVVWHIVESHLVRATKRNQHRIDASIATIVGHCHQSL